MKLPIWSEPGSRAKWERCLHQNAGRWNTRLPRSVKDKLPRSRTRRAHKARKHTALFVPFRLSSLISLIRTLTLDSRKVGTRCIVTKYCVSFRIDPSEMDHAAFGALRESLCIVFSVPGNCNDARAGFAFMHQDTATAEDSSVQTIRYQSRRQGWRSRDRYHDCSGVSDSAVRLSSSHASKS